MYTQFFILFYRCAICRNLNIRQVQAFVSGLKSMHEQKESCRRSTNREVLALRPARPQMLPRSSRWPRRAALALLPFCAVVLFLWQTGSIEIDPVSYPHHELNVSIKEIENFFNASQTIMERAPRTNKEDIAFVVLTRDHNLSEYQFAQITVRCYTLSQRIPFYQLTEADDREHRCQQTDFMFKRHCILAHFMRTTKHTWFIMLDADMGVVNPNATINEYIPKDPNVFVALTNRIMNSEIMTGSYIIRNNEPAHEFLLNWANTFQNFSGKIGSDNAAIHSAIVRKYLPDLESELAKCEYWWNNAKTYCRLFLYEVCARDLIDAKKIVGIQFFEKSKSYVRDGWLTSNQYGDHDFIFHNWKKSVKENPKAFGMWKYRFASNAFSPLSQCETANATALWKFQPNAKISDESIERMINRFVRNVNADRARQTRQYKSFDVRTLANLTKKGCN